MIDKNIGSSFQNKITSKKRNIINNLNSRIRDYHTKRTFWRSTVTNNDFTPQPATLTNAIPTIINGTLSIAKKGVEILFFDSTISNFAEKSFIHIHFLVFNYASFVRDALFDQWFYIQRLKIKPSPQQISNYKNRSLLFKTDPLTSLPITFAYNLSGSNLQTVTLYSDDKGHVVHSIEIGEHNQLLPYYQGVFQFKDRTFLTKFLLNRILITPVLRNRRLLISDIDDTIKYSNVLDKLELLKNTFINDFLPIKGMSEKYAELSKTDIDHFYYVSSSPWQLWPSLSQFLNNFGFPQPENIYLRKLVTSSISTLIKFLEDSANYKLETISKIIEKFSNNLEVILIGDSGERDPEIYNQLAIKYPQFVKKIIIRIVSGPLSTNMIPLWDHEHVQSRFSPEIWPLVCICNDGYDLSY